MNKKNTLRSHFATKSALGWFLEVGHHYATMNEAEALRLSGVNRTTFERWKKGQSSAPSATLELLRMYAFGEPTGGFKGEWRGFRFARGKLISDWGTEFTPQDLRAFVQFKRLANEYLFFLERGNIQTSFDFKGEQHESTSTNSSDTLLQRAG